MHRQIPIFINSNDDSISIPGQDNAVQINFSPTLDLSRHQTRYMSLISASIPFVSPNVSATLYQNQRIKFSNNSGSSYSTFNIEDGLYSVDLLNDALSQIFENNAFPNNLFVIQSDDSTGKTRIVFNSTTLIIRFDNDNSIRTLLGFNVGDYGTYTNAGQTISSQTQANFNRLQEILVRCSACTGVAYNGRSTGVLSPIPLLARAGGQINYQAIIPLKVPIITNQISSMRIELLDQDSNVISMQNEAWQLTIIIEMEPTIEDTSLKYHH